MEAVKYLIKLRNKKAKKKILEIKKHTVETEVRARKSVSKDSFRFLGVDIPNDHIWYGHGCSCWKETGISEQTGQVFFATKLASSNAKKRTE